MTSGCSIVVAWRRDEYEVQPTLAAIEAQIDPEDELILVADESSGTGEAKATHPRVDKYLSMPHGLTPQLWALGVASASNEVVVLTSAGMLPQQGWLEAAGSLRGTSFAAMGGAIEPGPDFGLVDWAMYFCRYSDFMLPLRPSLPIRLAADNIAYQKVILDRYRSVWKESFAEPFVHAAMQRDGCELHLTDRMLVQVSAGARAAEFARRRFAHGRVYGQMRSARTTRWKSGIAAAAAPLVPPLMVWRCGRGIWGKRRYRGRFVLALPLIVMFYFFWASGEAVGRLQSPASKASGA